MALDQPASAVRRENIPRSATRRSAEHGADSRPLSAWAELGAFVLLAEPGGGKSCAFQSEAGSSDGAYVKARTFATLGPPDGWCGQTLFIDGLDEMRADSASRHGPLDAVVQQLDKLGRPAFRLSCREADWLATIDQEALRDVAPEKQIEALHLDPLNDKEVTELLRRRSDRISDPARFREDAESRGLDGLLRNPLLLELLVDAVGDVWPRGRADVYRLACERMADEHNDAIREARAQELPLRDHMLHDAGLLCAVLLLAGLDAWVDGVVVDSSADVPTQALHSALGVTNAKAALSSKLFIAAGQRRLPRHRSVAEYLAACAISRRVIQDRLPMSRVLALMSGLDGGIVEPLRGLHAWLAVTCPPQRAVLIDRDPLACVLYGDVRSFCREDKRRVLDGLRREAERYVWFRTGNWDAHPFGALGTVDMAPEFAALLDSADRSPAHQSLLDCALDAIHHGEPMPQLLPRLEAVMRDATYRDDLRSSALDAWLQQSSTDLSKARAWLDQMRDGVIDDPRDELCGRLLESLYPALITPAEVMQHLHVSKADNFIGTYRHFWFASLLKRTPEVARPLLADALAVTGLSKDALNTHYELPRLIATVVTAALNVLRSPIDVSRVAQWLAVGIDQYGSAAAKGDDSRDIRDWLERHPDVQKALVAHQYTLIQPDPRGHFHFWSGEEILHRAQRPRDWMQWLLAHAAQVGSPPLVEYCFMQAAQAVLSQTSDFDIEMEEVECWVTEHEQRWPVARGWLECVWSSALDGYQGKDHRRQREDEAKRADDRVRRRIGLTAHFRAISSGAATPVVMHKLALAYSGRFSDIRAETPIERVQEFLAGSPEEAASAIAGIEATITRTDLPSVAEILEADLERKEHFLRPACLLGAELACTRNPDCPLTWADDLIRRLVAFRLADGTGDVPAWYNLLAERRPQIVAEVLGAFAQQCLLQRAEQSITGLWPLARDAGQAELARLVIPPLLRNFPVRARPAQLRRLNTELLPAAIRHLCADELKAVITERLAMECLDSGQRIAWLVAGLRFAAHQRSRQLSQLVGKSRIRALRLSDTMGAQADHASSLPRLPAAAVGRLIEMLAPITTPEYPTEDGLVGSRERLRDIVRGLVNQLATLDDTDAAGELSRLRALPVLAAWQISFDAALFEHVRVVRSASFSHASVDAVTLALAGEAPANALDLAALVRQHLSDLQARLVGDDTNSLHRFWRHSTAADQQPITENDCRDLLLGELRYRLEGQNVSLHKEAAHANDTRADLRAESMVEGQRKVVPIEIKKEDHRELWTAWRDQLEGRYMTDPAAEGVGIYLILWFGHRPKADPQGVVPSSSKELAERLTALVPPEDRVRLQVCVLDLSVTSPAARHGRKTKRRAKAARPPLGRKPVAAT